MFGQLKTQSGKILLWLLAVAILGFVASLIPHVRRHMPWFQAETRKETKVGRTPLVRSNRGAANDAETARALSRSLRVVSDALKGAEVEAPDGSGAS